MMVSKSVVISRLVTTEPSGAHTDTSASSPTSSWNLSAIEVGEVATTAPSSGLDEINNGCADAGPSPKESPRTSPSMVRSPTRTATARASRVDLIIPPPQWSEQQRDRDSGGEDAPEEVRTVSM